MAPPLVLDIDGTLTRADSERVPTPIDPRLFDRLADWEAPVIIATGKAFPYPIALCQFMGIDRNVIAENGGIAVIGQAMERFGKGGAARTVLEELADAGVDTSPDELDLINRWRETEAAFALSAPLEQIEPVADRHGLHIVDTGYAYHVKDDSVTKGRALEWAIDQLVYELADVMAIGDSINDVSVFERVGTAVAVANADADAQAAADHVTDAPHADGVLEALDTLA